MWAVSALQRGCRCGWATGSNFSSLGIRSLTSYVSVAEARQKIFGWAKLDGDRQRFKSLQRLKTKGFVGHRVRGVTVPPHRAHSPAQNHEPLVR